MWRWSRIFRLLWSHIFLFLLWLKGLPGTVVEQWKKWSLLDQLLTVSFATGMAILFIILNVIHQYAFNTTVGRNCAMAILIVVMTLFLPIIYRARPLFRDSILLRVVVIPAVAISLSFEILISLNKSQPMPVPLFLVLLLYTLFTISWMANEASNIAKMSAPAKMAKNSPDNVQSFLYKMRHILILILYVVSTWYVIFEFFLGYSLILEWQTNALIYNCTKCLPSDWNPLYFSATTYFTVGYGDIIPNTDLAKTVATVEMMIGHVMNVFFGAWMFYFFVHSSRQSSTSPSLPEEEQAPAQPEH